MMMPPLALILMPMLWAKIACAATYTLNAQYAVSSPATTMTKNLANTGNYFLEYSTGIKIFGMSTDSGSTAGGKLAAFYYDGTVVASLTYGPSTQASFTMVMKDPLRMFTVNSYAMILSYKLTENAGVYTLSADAFTMDTSAAYPNNRYVKGFEKPGTVYIFFARYGTGSRNLRYDSSVNSAVYSTQTAAASDYAYHIGMFGSADNLFLNVLSSSTTIPVVDMTTLTLAKTFSLVLSCNAGLIDNLNKNKLYLAYTNTANGVKSYDLAAAMVSGTLTTTDSFSKALDQMPMLNMGSLPYFAGFSSTVIYVFNKMTLNSFVSISSLSITYYSTFGTQTVGAKVYLAFMHGTNYNFQTYYLMEDLCVTRSSQICQTCPPGYYRNNLLANNVCILPAAFSASYGANNANFVMTACSRSNCQDCTADYSTCTTCSSSGPYYQYGGSCYLSVGLPNGVGADPITGNGVACQSTGCTNCKANYQTCIACDTGSSYYLHSGSCYTVATIPTGYGFVSATNSIQACSDTKCSDCRNNYATCTACSASYYRLSGACYTQTGLPPGSGVSGPGVAASCTSNGCTDCRAAINSCQACNTGLGFNLVGTACMTSVPDGYGWDSVSSSNVACGVSSCSKCQADYTICHQCTAASSSYVYNNQCTLPSALPNGKGVNSGTAPPTVVNCNEGTCIKCQADYSQCTECNVGGGYYLYSGRCYAPTGLPDGVGLDSSTNTIKNCFATNCLRCRSDYQACTNCQPSFYLSGGICYAQSDLPDGVGVDQGTNLVANCQVAFCRNCQADYSTCTTCQTNYYLVANSCYAPGSIPNGYGISGSNPSQAIQCSDTKCKQCRADAGTCGQCLPNTGYALLSGSCVSSSSLPNGLGYNPTTGDSQVCDVSHCTRCQQDYRICTACDTSTSWYLLQSSCVTPSSIQDRFGVNAGSGGVSACQDGKCNKCRMDYQVCTECVISPAGYILQGTSCVFNDQTGLPGSSVEPPSDSGSIFGNESDDDGSESPQAFNLFLAFTESMQNCSKLPGCIICNKNQTVCSQCSRLRALELRDNVCYCKEEPYDEQSNKCPSMILDSLNRDIELTSTTWDLGSKRARIKFDRTIVMSNDVSGFHIELIDDSQKYLLRQSDFKIISKNGQDYFEVDIFGSYDLDNGYMKITVANQSTTSITSIPKTYSNYPIIVKEITMLNEEKTAEVLQTTKQTKTLTLAIGSIALLSRGANTAAMADKMASNFLYFRFLNGPSLYYPELILDFLSQDTLSLLNIDNPMQDFTESSQQLPSNYQKREVRPNFLFNYGLQTILIYCTLVINIIISLTYQFFFAKSHADPSQAQKRAARIFIYIQKMFGVRMIISQMMGSMMEILCYGLVNTYSFEITFPMVVGLFQSAMFVAYFIICAVVTTRMARAGGGNVPIGTSLEQFSKTKLSAFTAIYEGYILQLKGYALYMPLIDICRGFVIHSVIYLLSSMGMAQVFVLLFLELVYLAFIFTHRVKSSVIENILDLMNASSCAVYLGGIVLSNYVRDSNTRQRKIGALMGGALILTIAANFIFVAIQILLTLVYEPLAHLWRSYQKPKVGKVRPKFTFKQEGKENSGKSPMKVSQMIRMDSPRKGTPSVSSPRRTDLTFNRRDLKIDLKLGSPSQYQNTLLAPANMSSSPTSNNRLISKFRAAGKKVQLFNIKDGQKEGSPLQTTSNKISVRKYGSRSPVRLGGFSRATTKLETSN